MTSRLGPHRDTWFTKLVRFLSLIFVQLLKDLFQGLALYLNENITTLVYM